PRCHVPNRNRIRGRCVNWPASAQVRIRGGATASHDPIRRGKVRIPLNEDRRMGGLQRMHNGRHRTGTREAQHGKDEHRDDWGERDETGDSLRGIPSGPSSIDVWALKQTPEDGVFVTTEAAACPEESL